MRGPFVKNVSRVRKKGEKDNTRSRSRRRRLWWCLLPLSSCDG